MVRYLLAIQLFHLLLHSQSRIVYMKSCRVLIADEQPIFAEGLRTILTAQERLLSCKVHLVSREELQVSEALRHHAFDAALLDLSPDDARGLRLIGTIKQAHPSVHILTLMASEEPGLVKSAFRAGADGCLMKNASQEELLRALEQILIGNTYLGVRAGKKQDTASATQEAESQFARRFGLTRREVQVMSLIGQALNNRDIAAKLFISDQTAGVHRKNIMRKLKVNSTANLIRIAFENGLAP